MTDRPGPFRRHRPLWIFPVAVLGLGLSMLVILRGIEGHGHAAEGDRPVSAPQRVTIENGVSVITLDVAAQRQSGIAVVALTNTPYQQQLRAFGTVLDLQTLTDLRNSYVSAQAQVQGAQAKLAASQPAFDRARTLYKDQQTISAAQFQAAEAAFRTDQASLAAAESQVRALAATAGQNWGSVLGQGVMDGSPLIARLIERQEILLQVTLSPGVVLTNPPPSALVQPDNDPRIKIQLVSPATKTDPRIQGIGLFYTAPADGVLLPGMNVLAFLPSGKTVDGAIVPASAIVWWQGRAWVYLRTGPETFARHEVDTDLPAPDGGYVVTGLADNAQLVTQGAQLLLSEEFRPQAPAGATGDQD